jgi:hypothetical protein
MVFSWRVMSVSPGQKEKGFVYDGILPWMPTSSIWAWKGRSSWSAQVRLRAMDISGGSWKLH